MGTPALTDGVWAAAVGAIALSVAVLIAWAIGAPASWVAPMTPNAAIAIAAIGTALVSVATGVRFARALLAIPAALAASALVAQGAGPSAAESWMPATSEYPRQGVMAIPTAVIILLLCIAIATSGRPQARWATSGATVAATLGTMLVLIGRALDAGALVTPLESGVFLAWPTVVALTFCVAGWVLLMLRDFGWGAYLSSGPAGHTFRLVSGAGTAGFVAVLGLGLGATRADALLTPAEALVLSALAAAATILVIAVMVFRRMRDLEMEIETVAGRDPITGQWNRLAILDLGSTALAGAARSGASIDIVLIDVDGLKRVNDTFGHESGTCLIRVVGEAIRRSTRAGDAAGRLGGDEFIVIAAAGPGASGDLVQRIRAAARVEAAQAPWVPEISAGVATAGQDGTSLGDLMRVADDRMYEDKRRRAVPDAAPRARSGFSA